MRAASQRWATGSTHWVYVSSASVYTDNATPGQRAVTAPTSRRPRPPSTTGRRSSTPVRAVQGRLRAGGAATGSAPARAFICRAGLIVGPEDVSGRFTYWPVRLARGGEVLAPGTPDDPVQWVDVRDLAQWLVYAARERVAGTYDGIGASVPRSAFLAASRPGSAPTRPAVRLGRPDFRSEKEVEPWAGPRSLPLWLPLPEYAGFLARDTADSLAAGLILPRRWPTRPRPPSTGGGPRKAATGPGRGAGLTAEEAELLAAWH